MKPHHALKSEIRFDHETHVFKGYDYRYVKNLEKGKKSLQEDYAKWLVLFAKPLNKWALPLGNIQSPKPTK